MPLLQSNNPCYFREGKLHKLFRIVLAFAILACFSKTPIKCQEQGYPRTVSVILTLPSEVEGRELVCDEDTVNESVKIIEDESRELLQGKYKVSLKVFKQGTLSNEEYLKVVRQEINNFSDKESVIGVAGDTRLVQESPGIYPFKTPFCAVFSSNYKKANVNNNAEFLGTSGVHNTIETLVRTLGSDKVNVFIFSSLDLGQINQSLSNYNVSASVSGEGEKNFFVLRDALSLKYALDSIQVRGKRVRILTGNLKLALEFLVEAHRKDLTSANIWIGDTIPDIQQMLLLLNNDSQAVCEIMKSLFIREPPKSQISLLAALEERNFIHSDAVSIKEKLQCTEYMVDLHECITGFINDFVCVHDGLCGIVNLSSGKRVLPTDLLHMSRESTCDSVNLGEPNSPRGSYKKRKVRDMEAVAFDNIDYDYGDDENSEQVDMKKADPEDQEAHHTGLRLSLSFWNSAALIVIVSLMLIFYGFIAVLICRTNPRRASINCPKISLTILFGFATHLLIVLSFTWKSRRLSCLAFRILPVISEIIIFTGLLAKTLVILSVFSLKNYKKKIKFPTTRLFILSGIVILACLIYGVLVENKLLNSPDIPGRYLCSILYKTLETELVRLAMNMYSLGLKFALGIALYKSRSVHRGFRQITSISLAIYNYSVYEWINSYLFIGGIITFRRVCVYSAGLIILSLVSTISIFFTWFTKIDASHRDLSNSMLSEDMDGMFAANKLTYDPGPLGKCKFYTRDSNESSIYKCYITTTGMWGFKGLRRQRVLLILDLRGRMYMVQKIFTIDIRRDENESPKEYVDTVGKSFYIREENVKIVYQKNKDSVPKVVIRNSHILSTTIEFDSMSEYERFIAMWNSYFKSPSESLNVSKQFSAAPYNFFPEETP